MQLDHIPYAVVYAKLLA